MRVQKFTYSHKSTYFPREIWKVGVIKNLSGNWYHISKSMKVSRYFERSTHFKRKNLLMKKDFFEDLSELDDFSTVIKLHYLKEILIPAKWKRKIQPSWRYRDHRYWSIFSSSQVFHKRVVLKNLAKFTGKHPHRPLASNFN